MIMGVKNRVKDYLKLLILEKDKLSSIEILRRNKSSNFLMYLGDWGGRLM